MFGVFGLSLFRSEDQIQKLKIQRCPTKRKNRSRLRRQKQYFFTENYEVEQRDEPDVIVKFRRNRNSKILMQGSKLKLFQIESSCEKRSKRFRTC